MSDFREMYGVGPIFFLEWPKHQVFLREPSAPLIIERSTGRLAKPRTGVLWRTDYREVKAFRPADVAPLIAEILAGGSPWFWDDEWRPMVMSEIRVHGDNAEPLATRLAALDVYFLRWCGPGESCIFRLFGEPGLLVSLAYAEAPLGGV